MPFQRRYDRESRDFVFDRSLTGPPKPKPSTGKAQTATGVIVGSAANQDIPPATPIPVSIPGINEPVVDSRGVMSPRWWRFFEELYRRTGALEDNINRTEILASDSTTTVALVLTGVVPSVIVQQTVAGGSLSITGTTATATISSPMLTVGPLTLTGIAPTILVGQPVAVGGLTLTGNAPIVNPIPSTGSLNITGAAPLINPT